MMRMRLAKSTLTQMLKITCPKSRLRRGTTNDEDGARDLNLNPQDDVDAQRAEDEGRSMTRDEGEASENKFGPYFEEKESKPRNNDDANEAPH